MSVATVPLVRTPQAILKAYLNRKAELLHRSIRVQAGLGLAVGLGGILNGTTLENREPGDQLH